MDCSGYVVYLCPPFRCFGSCSPKAKPIQSHACKQNNNCPRFGNKSRSSCIPTEQVSFVLIYTFSIKHRLRTTDWV